jgi:SAM-dependent methyltransferase
MTGPDADAGNGEGNQHWFEPLADHLGPAYLKYSFTRGTVAEVESLIELTGVAPGARVLDVGCGPGRHGLELARRGYEVVGVDIAKTFIDLAVDAAASEGLTNASFRVCDARALDYEDEFDLVISLCQGAFGLTAGPGSGLVSLDRELDEPVLAGLARAAKPGGTVAVSAFSAYFQLRFEEATDAFDAGLGVNEEVTTIRNVDGEERQVRLWTTCYTPRELRLLARVVGLDPVGLFGVTPGRYRDAPPATDCPEFLLVAQRHL